MVTHTRLLAVFALLCVFLLPGMAVRAQSAFHPRPQPTGPCPTAVVLDFTVAPRVVESRDCCTRRINYREREVITEKDSRGWWFNRQDIYVNANIGRIAADAVADKLKTDGIYQVRSRGDVKIYYADKKDLLNDRFSMTREEVNKAVLLLDPVSIGREMGVQKVVVGHICDGELRKSRVPGSFATVASFQVAVFDVASGMIEFQQCYTKFENHRTEYFAWQQMAKEVSHDILMNRVGMETVQQYQAYQQPAR